MSEYEEDEREIELSSIKAIFDELEIDSEDPFHASLDIPVMPSRAVRLLLPSKNLTQTSTPAVAEVQQGPPDHIEDQLKAKQRRSRRDYRKVSHLPPLHLDIRLPEGYPSNVPPIIQLSTTPAWIPHAKVVKLESKAKILWNEYGQGQVVFAFIDMLQQEAEECFKLRVIKSDWKRRFLPVQSSEMTISLLDFDKQAKSAIFAKETFPCSICLAPKKGVDCHRMLGCGHVFCVACLLESYDGYITQGEVENVKCLEFKCKANEGKRSRRKRRGQKDPPKKTLNPTELMQIGLSSELVQRYVGLKRKRELESDKTTVYCPRQHCQAPARTARMRNVADLDADLFSSDSSDAGSDKDVSDDENDEDAADATPAHERLRICSACNFAFCRRCKKSWHGDFQMCMIPIADMTDEERLTTNYLRLHTSPCPSCEARCQKTHGCNHMLCFQCSSHFCYLCSAWLDPQNPYSHFNTKGSSCFMRLWDFEGGDEGGFVGDIGPRGAAAALIAAEEAEAREAAMREELFRQQAAEGAENAAEGRLIDEHEIWNGIRPNQRPRAEAPRAPDVAVEPQLVIAMDRLMAVDQPQAAGRPGRRRARRPIERPNIGEVRAAERERRANEMIQNGANARAANLGGRGAHPDMPLQPRRRPAGVDPGLQRFLELAAADREDEWDSDEMEEIEGGWDIHFA